MDKNTELVVEPALELAVELFDNGPFFPQGRPGEPLITDLQGLVTN
jgi:hypothetical protein